MMMMETNAQVRNHYDARLMNAFETALAGLNGADGVFIADERFSAVRTMLCEEIALWLQKVGMVSGASLSYIRMPNHELDELVSIFFASGNLNNRLTHYLNVTRDNGSHAALKSLAVSANNVALDNLPSSKSATKPTMVDMETIEGTLATGDTDRPDHVADARHELATFWKMLVDLPLEEILTYLTIPMKLPRHELVEMILDDQERHALIVAIRDRYADILGDAARASMMFKPLFIISKAYKPDLDSAPLLTRIRRYTGKDGKLDRFYNRFQAALAA